MLDADHSNPRVVNVVVSLKPTPNRQTLDPTRSSAANAAGFGDATHPLINILNIAYALQLSSLDLTTS